MKYNLTTKSGEVISKCEGVSLEDAEKYFALRKQMEVIDLLKIYRVVRDK